MYNTETLYFNGVVLTYRIVCASSPKSHQVKENTSELELTLRLSHMPNCKEMQKIGTV